MVAGVKDLAEATGALYLHPQPATQFPHKFARGSGSGANDSLAAHEQTYQEITTVLEREERRLNEQRKQAGGNSKKLKKLVQDTLDLCTLKQFNSLLIEYHWKKAKNPSLKLCPSLDASTVIAKRLGKSDYYARRLREKVKHLHQVGELQILKRGKGVVHWSLLSDPRVVTGIQTWVKGAIPVEKGGYIGRVWCSK